MSERVGLILGILDVVAHVAFFGACIGLLFNMGDIEWLSAVVVTGLCLRAGDRHGG